MTQSLIQDLLTILAAGLAAGLICRRLHVSVLIGYLVAGILLGQGALGWVLDEHGELEHFAEAGVFLLLFSIGLEFSLDDMRRLGASLLIGGATQMVLVAVPVAALMIGFGSTWQAAALTASAVAFSSTVLVFKALSECGQTEKPHGVRAIGILLFQDAALVPLLLLVPLLTGSVSGVDADGISPGHVLQLVATSVLFVIAVFLLRSLLARWLIPALAQHRSPELVILSTIVMLGGVALAAHVVGLPASVGAFAAGLIFNGNRWTRQIDALVLPFRETFSAIFFVSLGLILKPTVILEQPITMLVLLVSVIVIKAAAATLALRFSGLSTRQSFGMGIGLAHVGEFAFVLALLGLESGVISPDRYQQLVSLAVGSLILTPALMKLGLGLIRPVDSLHSESDLPTLSVEKSRQAVVIGAGPAGRRIASQLENTGKDVCLVDLSPLNLHPFAQEGFRTVAGDATHQETLLRADVAQAIFIAICVPDDLAALHIVKAIRKNNPQTVLIVRCRYHVNSRGLSQAGADRVVSEEAEASQKLLEMIRNLDAE